MIEIHKMKKRELIVLAMMLSCYIASLFLLIRSEKSYALLFFILHGVLTIIYFYISQDSLIQGTLDLTEKRARYGSEEIEKKNKMIAQLQQEKKETDEEQKRLSEHISVIQKKNEELLQRLSQKENDEIMKKERDADKILLPINEVVKDTDLISVIRNTCEKYTDKCRKNGIRLEVATAFEALKMQCDERYIDVLLSNIIDNSIKYMNRNGSLIITISQIGEEGIFIVCKDNGNGLSKNEVSRIFELNYQGSNQNGGTGLGLSQVKAVVEHYNGTVYAKSDEGEGMAVYIQFPLENKG